MSKPDVEAYLKSWGVNCPYCGAENSVSEANIGEIQENGCALYRGAWCETCKKQWTDEYTLTGITEDPGDAQEPAKAEDNGVRALPVTIQVEGKLCAEDCQFSDWNDNGPTDCLLFKEQLGIYGPTWTETGSVRHLRCGRCLEMTGDKKEVEPDDDETGG